MKFATSWYSIQQGPPTLVCSELIVDTDFEIYALTIMVWNLLRLGVLWVDGRYRFPKIWFNHRGLEIDWLSKCDSCVTHNQPFLTRTIVRLCTYLDIAFMHAFLFTCRLPVCLHAWTSIFFKSELDDSCSRFNIVGTLHAIIQVTSIQGVNDENVNMEQKRSEHRYEFSTRPAARIFGRRRYSCRSEQHPRHTVLGFYSPCHLGCR